jgi:hypothetical protein
MRRVLIFAWGDDGGEWVGKSMTLYNDPSVEYGGVKVGGIRISHLSHIERDIAILLTAKRGKKQEFVIKKLTVARESVAQPAENSATEPDSTALISSDQSKAILDALKAGSVPLEAFLKAAGTQSVQQIAVTAYDRAMGWIGKRAKAATAKQETDSTADADQATAEEKPL